MKGEKGDIGSPGLQVNQQNVSMVNQENHYMLWGSRYSTPLSGCIPAMAGE